MEIEFYQLPPSLKVPRIWFIYQGPQKRKKLTYILQYQKHEKAKESNYESGIWVFINIFMLEERIYSFSNQLWGQWKLELSFNITKHRAPKDERKDNVKLRTGIHGAASSATTPWIFQRTHHKIKLKHEM